MSSPAPAAISQLGPSPSALSTDLYELKMAGSYIERGMTGTATFSLFVRRLGENRAFLVAAGIESCLELIESFRFEGRDLEYLSEIGFDERTLEAFATLEFRGEVRAVPEGRIVFADEPLLEVTGPIPEAQLLETHLLNQITFQTAIASKAARCKLAAAGRIDLVDFGLRRCQGMEAGMAAARSSAMVGFSATSNVEAARRFGLTASGTMAHSYVEAFATEREAFEAFADDHPDSPTFLVDTYDTLAGTATAAEVIQSRGLQQKAAIRIDSGVLEEVARDARRLLDDAALPEVRIFVSGDLDEYRLAELVASAAPVDAAGVGTRMGVSADAPYLNSVYKLVEYDGRPVAKTSVGKATTPGAKQVFRSPGLDDVLGLRSEVAPGGSEALLQTVMEGGRRTSEKPDPAAAVTQARQRFEEDLSQLRSELRGLDHAPVYLPEKSSELLKLAARLPGRG